MMDNVSVITTFFLSGLSETKNIEVTLFCITLLCYCMILLTNVSVIVIIITDKNLHEPMYILLCILCLNGLYGTTGFYPKFLWDLLSPVHVISYSGCLVQSVVFASFVCSDLSILAVMAYDRYVAICRPLQYHSVMSKQKVIGLVCFCWMTPVFLMTVNVSLTSRLQLCSQQIDRLYCVNWTIVKLACFPAKTTGNDVVAYMIILIYSSHGLYIVWSYMYLIKTCVNSAESQRKFMQTCVPHLTSLITFLVTVLFDVMNTRVGWNDIPQNLQNFITVEFLVIPPVMNPLIYGFKLTKIQNKILGVITYKIR